MTKKLGRNPLLPIVQRSIHLGLDPSNSVEGLGAVLLQHEAEVKAAAMYVCGSITPPKNLNQALQDQFDELVHSIGGLIEWLFLHRELLRIERDHRMLAVILELGRATDEYKSDPTYMELEARRLAVERTLRAL